MILNYFIALIGAALGMLLTVLVQSELINRSDKYKAGFNEAFKFYTNRNRGGLYIGGTVVLIFLFVMPNLITSNQKYLENFLENLRWWSIAIGVGSQAIGFLIVRKTHQQIDKINDNE